MPRIAKPAALRIPTFGEQFAAGEVDAFSRPIERPQTSAATHGVQKPAGAASSVFDAAKQAKPPRKRMQMLDLGAVQIQHDVPLQMHKRDQLSQAYNELLDKMKPGDSVLLTRTLAAGLRTVGAKRGRKMVTRGEACGGQRVWLLEGAHVKRGARP